MTDKKNIFIRTFMNEDFIIQTLLDHSIRLDRIEQNMATKDDFKKIMDVLDQQGVILRKLDQENTAFLVRFQRIENHVGLI